MAFVTIDLMPSEKGFKEWLKKYHPAGRPSFTRKTLAIKGQTYNKAGRKNAFANAGAHNAYGQANQREMYEVTKVSDLDKEILGNFNKYLNSHRFVPVMNNPGANSVKMMGYYEKAYAYCKNARKKDPAMLARGWHDFDADKKFKHNASMSSSWVRDAKQTSENVIELNLGGRYYKYGITNLHQFLTCPSIGQTVAYLRNRPSGTSWNGLKKLFGSSHSGKKSFKMKPSWW